MPVLSSNFPSYTALRFDRSYPKADRTHSLSGRPLPAQKYHKIKKILSAQLVSKLYEQDLNFFSFLCSLANSLCLICLGQQFGFQRFVFLFRFAPRSGTGQWERVQQTSLKGSAEPVGEHDLKNIALPDIVFCLLHHIAIGLTVKQRCHFAQQLSESISQLTGNTLYAPDSAISLT